MLFGHRPHTLKPGQNVLVWGASGGLGSMAVQLIATAGGNAIGVISDDDKAEFVMSLGARGVINRKNFKCWGEMPKVGTPDYNEWLKNARDFGKAIWNVTGKGNNVDMSGENPDPLLAGAFWPCCCCPWPPRNCSRSFCGSNISALLKSCSPNSQKAGNTTLPPSTKMTDPTLWHQINHSRTGLPPRPRHSW